MGSRLTAPAAMSFDFLTVTLIVAGFVVLLLIGKMVWRLIRKKEPADSLWLIDQMVDELEEHKKRRKPPRN